MSIAEIIALLAAITALFVAIANGMKQRSDAILTTQRDKLTAKRDEFTLLSSAFDQLEERNTALYGRVRDLEAALETERCKRRELETAVEVERGKRRELEAVVMAKDKRISDLETEVGELQRRLQELGETPPRKRKATGNLEP
jgi:predicted RNase H-like nuclease (RuvC/YqgF family)